MTDATTGKTKATLYYTPVTRSQTPLIMLEECGVPYELHKMNLRAGDQRKPEFLALNPMGKVPVLVHGDAVVSESAAICAYLAEVCSDANLAPPLSDGPARAAYLRWIIFSAGCVEQAFVDLKYPRQKEFSANFAGWGDTERVLHTLNTALKDNPYLMGKTYMVPDILIGRHIQLLTRIDMLDINTVPVLADYLTRLTERPAWKRVAAIEQEQSA